MSPKIAKKDTPRLWKDHLSRKAVGTFAKKIENVYPSFKTDRYTSAVLSDGFLKYELKQRIDRMAESLYGFLPDDYSKAIKVLIDVAPHVRIFENWVLTGYVEKFGLKQFEASVKALAELTKFGTSEFGIRPFMIKYTDRMLPVLMQWTQDPNEHVRRLAAEGSRPRGVWTAHIEAFKKNPSPVFAILEKLKSDESLYVRKAVANNLNDISKEHPDLAVKTVRKWLKAGDERTDWIIKRGCRTLIKNGHPGALALFGFAGKPSVNVKSFALKPAKARIGDTVTFVLKLQTSAKKKQKLSIDYKVHFVTKNGSKSVRLFKWAVKSIDNSTGFTLEKKQPFKDIFTRRHFPGEHLIEVLINGKVVAIKSARLL